MKTLNKAVARYNGISLIVRILIGLFIGAVLALVAPGAGWVGELGSLFVGALKGIAPVLVFVIVASALAQGSSKLDRRFGTVIWLYMLTTFLAAAIAVVTSFMFPVTVVLADAAQSDVVPQGLGEVMGTLLTNFVANPVSAIMSGNYIGILFWACMFGVAMKKIGSDTTKTFMANTADAVSQIVRWIINLAPFGIMGLVYTNVSGNGLAIFTQYGKLLALLVGTMLFMALIVSPFIMFIYLGCNPYPLVFRCLRESGLTAFFTRSSAANIPVNMALCEKLGLDKDMYSVSIPLGATINMDGAAITITIMTLAAANTLGIQVSLPAAIVLSAPIVSEKATMVAEKSNVVTFKVLQDATKHEIMAAVQLMFNVEVKGVSVLNTKGKAKRFGKSMGRRDNVRKAYVMLKPGQEINLAGEAA